jgi:hypothetical protein
VIGAQCAVIGAQLVADIADVPADFLKNVMLLIMVAITIWAAVFKKPAPVPQPMVTQKAADYVPRHEFSALQTEVREVREGMHHMERRILDKGEERAISIHNRITPLAEGVHEMAGELKNLQALGTQIHTLTNLIGREKRSRSAT